jgi:flagellar protein FliO/FliZ
MTSRYLTSVIAFLALPMSPVFAAESTLTGQSAILDTSSLLQMLLALGVVVVLIIGLSVAVRKFNMFNGSGSGHIRIVGGLALSNKDRLLLVQVGDEQLLISTSPGRVQKIHEMQSPIALAREGDEKPANPQNFSNLLQSLTQRGRS